jgi:predicted GIY-YIG superfamily endonuclease
MWGTFDERLPTIRDNMLCNLETTPLTKTFPSCCIIYALKLEGDNYYIGQTTNLNGRLASHLQLDGPNSTGAIWTRKHKPQSLVELFITPSDSDPYDLEKEITLKYMKEYGLDKVRGAAWCHESFTVKKLEGLQELGVDTTGVTPKPTKSKKK